ncbi:CDP-6-deoxy-delta-3,4-glucoseen reductase [Uliginosibacterium sp. TH139]|uniref:CDP-6-deoxy-delta-3,4-glucoseen reductase n=1 Tax=Uliginosibacterium sp. TH139 TaxID=2067453 RepID=UPI000C7E5A5E|nr:CDP-6-deoxy-delta-3,4-glucoseen reductase [Uliginosibacterium sp. TH139]PLK50040.1 CDP-6-deoxy-delta-3,4-glucoseen reductase [Uliginosibacterium sp. TH139]
MSFKVTLQPSGRSFAADADTSLLQAALDAELMVPYGCRDGACGACKTKVLAGSVDHGRSPLTTLPEAERAQGLSLMCCAHAHSDLVLECRDVRSAHDIPVRKMPCRVQSLEKLASDVIRLTLRLPPSDTFHFLPGQYIDFLLADGQRRSFSVANAQNEDNTLELHVRLITGGQFTGHVFTAMKERDILRIEGPLGSFFLREAPEEGGHKPLVFLAGGTGFAPIKAIVEHMLNHGNGRPATLYWGARDPGGLYLHELAQSWERQLANFRYVPVISDATEGWSGRTGLVHQAVMADLPDLSGHQVYACGAPAMIEAAKKDFSERCALPLTDFYADAFTFAASPQT